jgi:hypothetical protein
MTYRERREAKADRLRARAEKREVKAAVDLDRGHQMAAAIPFGQPILVGHYSERRDRRYRDRIGATIDRGLASAFHQGRRHPGRTPAEAALGTGGVLSRWAGSCPCP